MTPPRDPDEVEQTLVPGAPEKPASDSDANTETPAGPNTSDATLITPANGIVENPITEFPFRAGKGSSPSFVITTPAPAGPGLTINIPTGPTTPTAPPTPSSETLAPAPAVAPKTVRLSAAVAKAPAPTVTTTTPGAPAVPVAPPAPADPGETLVSPRPEATPASVPGPSAHEKVAPSGDTAAAAEQTLLRTPPPAGSSPKTIVGTGDATGSASADPAATLPTPGARTVAPSGTGTSPESKPGPAPGPRLGASPSATGTMVGRFALKNLHASGGLGEVFLARDTELNREVAVKRIKSQYADDPGSRGRFLSEATLTARLDHPGVVPVFGLVNDVRGRPCYAMRFIRGETLKDEIERYHKQGSGVRGPGSEKTDKTDASSASAEPGSAASPEGAAADNVPRSVAFRHLLARFIATCQAIAYAHKKGIIHRDIKPANIMVGSFGETLVVDWGLAKSLDDSPDFDRVMKAQAEAGFRHDPDATDLPSHMTHAGTAVGTPAYMAPEQAAGDLHAVGPRADVYALGATLFVILTGKAPVAGKSTAEVLEKVRGGAYEPAAAVNPECPKPLDAVCRKAMALRPEDRYATALELAADVERWISDEPVTCYTDPPLARLARWARHHPTRVAAGVSIILASMIAAIAIAIVYQQGKEVAQAERDNVRREQEKTKEALEQVTAQQQLTDAALKTVVERNMEIERQKARVEQARDVATSRYDKAVAAFNVLITEIDARLARRLGTDDLRQDLLRNATEGLKKLLETKDEDKGKDQLADRTLVAAYRQMGDVYRRLGDTAKAQKYLEEAVEQARAVKRAVEQARVTPATPAEQREADRDLGRSLDLLAAVLLQAGKSDEALKKINEAIELFAVLAADPNDPNAADDLARARQRRSEILTERGNTLGALKDCILALNARKELAPQGIDPKADPNEVTRRLDRRRAYASSLDALAGLQLRASPEDVRKGDEATLKELKVGTEAALDSALRSRAVRLDLAKEFPNHPDLPHERAEARVRVGDVHAERGHLSLAAKEYSEGLDELSALVKEHPENAGVLADRALMAGRLGQAQLRLGEVEAALKNTKLGRDDAIDLWAKDPKSVRAQRDLALAHERYGDARAAAGYDRDALEEYRASATLLRPLDGDEQSTGIRLEAARALERLSDGYLLTKQPEEAMKAIEECVTIRRAVRKQDPYSATARRDLALGLYKLADANCGAGRPAGAGAPAEEATELFVALARDDPASARAQRDLALAYGKRGQVLAADRHPTTGLIDLQRSQKRCDELTKLDATNTQALEDEAAAWERLAAFYATYAPARARPAAEVAVEKWETITKGVDAKTKAGQRRVALAMLRCGDVSTEIGDFRKAAEWYEKAAREAKSEPTDLLLAPVAKLVADQQAYLKAVATGVVNVRDVAKFPPHVQRAALQTIARLALRSDDTTTAYVAALKLKGMAETGAEKFAVARALAGCAAARPGNEKVKQEYANEAVAQLKDAIAANFRNAGALNAPEWDAVGKRTKGLAEVKEQLAKLNAERN